MIYIVRFNLSDFQKPRQAIVTATSFEMAEAILINFIYKRFQVKCIVVAVSTDDEYTKCFYIENGKHNVILTN